MAKVSVVITVLNEQDSIGKLLKPLISQTKKPDEIILIDAGSTDRTVEVIKKFQRTHKKIMLLVKPGANRSVGRNIGVERAHGPIIAITDAGCIPKKDWLEKLTDPFKDKSVDVVGGYYKPRGNSVFQKSLAVYTCVLDHQLNPKTFLPASRSLAFRKEIWKKVGGFPEHLSTCEDRVFVEKLKKTKAKFTFAKEAIVYWKQKNTWQDAFIQLYTYSKGDTEALYLPHVKKILLVWARYLLGILLLVTFPVLLLFILPQYLAWVIGKGYSYVKDKRALLTLPLLQLTADLAVMGGSLAGFFKRRGVLQ